MTKRRTSRCYVPYPKSNPNPNPNGQVLCAEFIAPHIESVVATKGWLECSAEVRQLVAPLFATVQAMKYTVFPQSGEDNRKLAKRLLRLGCFDEARGREAQAQRRYDMEQAADDMVQV